MPGTHRRHGRDSWYPSHMTIKPRVHSARSVVGEPTELSEGLKQQGEGRSELIRQAVQVFLRDLRKRKDVERYVQGYIKHAERAEEVDAIRSASYAALAEEPWN